MNLHEFALSLIGAAFGAGFGFLVARLIRNRTWRSAVITASCIFGYSFTPLLLHKFGLHELPVSNARIEKATAEYSAPLLRDPAFQKATQEMSAADQSGFVQRLTHQGLIRLSVADLDQWNSIRLNLTEQDATVCAGFWTGRGLETDRLTKLFNKSAPGVLENWVRISMTAAKLEIDQAPYNAPSATAAEMFQHVMDQASEKDRVAMKKARSDGLLATDEDGCLAMRAFMKAAQAARGAEKEALLRMLAGI